MTGREKLIDILMQPCYPQMGFDRADALAEHILENGVTVQQWVSVEDRLPENGVWVLAWQKRGWMGIAQIEKDGWHWYTQDLVKLEDPSHWMPLPEPPKEE